MPVLNNLFDDTCLAITEMIGLERIHHHYSITNREVREPLVRENIKVLLTVVQSHTHRDRWSGYLLCSHFHPYFCVEYFHGFAVHGGLFVIV